MTLVDRALRATARQAADHRSLRSLLHALRQLHRNYVRSQDRHSRLLLAVQILYALVFGAWFVASHTWPAPDMVAIYLLVFAFLAMRGLSFLRDWSPFVLLLLAYVALTGIASGLSAHTHIGFPIQFDRWLFRGTLPTTFLQQHLWDPHHLHWYDYLTTSLYPMHFVIPLVLAFAFWLVKKSLYWRFVASYLLLSYAGFVTYVLYPMSPPWWTAARGWITPTADILGSVRYGNLPNPVVTATQLFRPNEVAAMPSIHAAFPVLVWLVLWRVWPRWGWCVVIYPLAMAFSVIYLGQHYVADVLAGWLYAFAAYFLVWDWGATQRPLASGLVSLLRRPSQVDHDRNTVAGGVASIALASGTGIPEVLARDVVAGADEGHGDNVTRPIELSADVTARRVVVAVNGRKDVRSRA